MSGGRSYTIKGVPVTFPYSAYPSQMAMMSKVLTSLTSGDNCLLESPTGSGKSLALLCSTLAWQAHLTKHPPTHSGHAQHGSPLDTQQADHCGDIHPPPPPPPPVVFYCTRTHKQIKQIVGELRKTVYADSVKMTILSSRDQCCTYKPPGRGDRYESPQLSKNERCKKLLDPREEGTCNFYTTLQRAGKTPAARLTTLRLREPAFDIEDLVSHGRRNGICPYFFSRDLASVAELVLCPYNYVIDPKIRHTMGVKVQGNVIILDEAHNIEDAARTSASHSATLTELANATDDLAPFCSFRKLSPEMRDAYLRLHTFMSGLSGFAEGEGSSLPANQFQETTRVFSGPEFISGLSSRSRPAPVTPDDFNLIRGALDKVVEDRSARDDQSEPGLLDDSLLTDDEDGGGGGGGGRKSRRKPKLSGETLLLVEALVVSLGFMYSSASDYRIVLAKKYERDRFARREQPEDAGSGVWLRKGGGRRSNTPSAASTESGYTVHFHVWCMNPAAVFGEIASLSRTVILASGTLSPLETFASELGCTFPVQLEAPHVIDKSQILVGAIARGVVDDGTVLKATFQNTQQLGFQDEVGRVVLEVCRVVPFGVLLFLPSYKLLGVLADRWRATGLYQQLEQLKLVVQEPQGAPRSPHHLADVIARFNRAIAHSEEHAPDHANDGGHSGGGGALLMAVCRGKVSEGIDFADNQARAVLCLGIPFPNFKDLQVELKMKFNDEELQRKRGLLSGGDWYEVQAFRALNQALGRCIRHRRDWGAVILLDDRFVSGNSAPRYVRNLPKWIRNFMHTQCPRLSTAHTLDTLRQFVRDQQERVLREQCLTHPPAAAAAAPPAELTVLEETCAGESNVPPAGAGAVCGQNAFKFSKKRTSSDGLFDEPAGKRRLSADPEDADDCFQLLPHSPPEETLLTPDKPAATVEYHPPDVVFESPDMPCSAAGTETSVAASSLLCPLCHQPCIQGTGGGEGIPCVRLGPGPRLMAVMDVLRSVLPPASHASLLDNNITALFLVPDTTEQPPPHLAAPVSASHPSGLVTNAAHHSALGVTFQLLFCHRRVGAAADTSAAAGVRFLAMPPHLSHTLPPLLLFGTKPAPPTDSTATL